MLQVFVPVGSALALALLGYWFTLRSDREAKATEARLAIQRRALEDAQRALMKFWLSAAKLLRFPQHERLDKKDLLAAMEDASAAVTVAYSRLQDRQLADDMADWHYATAQHLQSSPPLSAVDVNARNPDFASLSNRLGERLRELTPGDGLGAATHRGRKCK